VIAASHEDEIVLTFKEIAAMIGRVLPESAILTTGWQTRPADGSRERTVTIFASSSPATRQ